MSETQDVRAAINHMRENATRQPSWVQDLANWLAITEPGGLDWSYALAVARGYLDAGERPRLRETGEGDG